EQPERGQRSRGARDRDGDLPAASGVADEPPDRDRDDGSDDHGRERVVHVLPEPQRERIEPFEPLWREDPQDRVDEEVHDVATSAMATRPAAFCRLVHGMRSRPSSTSNRSMASATSIVTTTPVSTS